MKRIYFLFFILGILAFIAGLFLSNFAANIVAKELLFPLLLWPVLFAITLYMVKKSSTTVVYGLLITLATSALTYFSSYYFPWLMILLPLTLVALSIKFGFVLRAAAISYTAVILSFLVFFALSIPQTGFCQIGIKKLNNSEEFVEISWDELKTSPLLEDAIVNCRGKR